MWTHQKHIVSFFPIKLLNHYTFLLIKPILIYDLRNLSSLSIKAYMQFIDIFTIQVVLPKYINVGNAKYEHQTVLKHGCIIF